MIIRLLFSLCLTALAVAALSGLTKLGKPSDKVALLHKLVGICAPLFFIAGIVALFLTDVHHTLRISAINLSVWLILTGPVLGFLAKHPVLKMIHRLTGAISLAVVLLFVMYMLRF